MQAEEDAQTAYENFMKDSNKSIIAYTKSIVDMTEALSKTKESLLMAESDMRSTLKKLESLNLEAGTLHKSCDYILKNFDARQKGRAAEIGALKEAKAILSGMNE